MYSAGNMVEDNSGEWRMSRESLALRPLIMLVKATKQERVPAVTERPRRKVVASCPIEIDQGACDSQRKEMPKKGGDPYPFQVMGENRR